MTARLGIHASPVFMPGTPADWIAFALEATHASAWELDLRDPSVGLSEIWSKMIGESPAGRHSPVRLPGVVPRGDIARYLWVMEEVIEGDRQGFEAEHRITGADASPRWVRTVARVSARDPQSGRATHLMGINLDVTEQKQEEMALRHRLETQDARIRAMESLGDSATRELQTSARAITGFSNALLDGHAGPLPGNARWLVERVAQSGASMTAMLDGLAELSRVGQVELRRQRVDLTLLARQVWGELARAEPGRRIAFTAAEGCMARADRDLAEIALRNLLGNAFKFTRASADAQVEFGVAADDDGAHFFVKDNGAGFDMAGAAKLFRMFQRLHRPEAFEGTGVGLAIARRIVARHRGRIWAEAKPGVGATFRFTLARQAW